jgi:tRNA A37 threonylcarbamoyladenosine dehydratase
MILYKSINHLNTSLDERENYFKQLSRDTDSPSVFLQTCNRVELYYGTGDVLKDVACHLFRVACGLESAIVGERAVQGQVKVDALKERLLTINPSAEITALQKIFTAENADEFALDTYDYIIDAIDSLKDKAALILLACRTDAKFFSSMGAALKLDPTRIKVTEFWKVQGDPLARALRKKFKSQKQFPKHKFQCVYSDELLENRGQNATCGTEKCMCPKTQNGPGDQSLLNHEWCSSKAQINGTLSHITAIFGFMLAGLIIEDIAS